MALLFRYIHVPTLQTTIPSGRAMKSTRNPTPPAAILTTVGKAASVDGESIVQPASTPPDGLAMKSDVDPLVGRSFLFSFAPVIQPLNPLLTLPSLSTAEPRYIASLGTSSVSLFPGEVVRATYELSITIVVVFSSLSTVTVWVSSLLTLTVVCLAIVSPEPRL